MRAQLVERFAESAKLEGEIKKNLARLAFDPMVPVVEEASA